MTTDAASPTGSPRLGISTESNAGALAHLPTPLSARARVRLTHLLIGKSIIETLFLAVLAVVFIHQILHPSFRGSVDAASESYVSGWVVDDAAPGTRVEVQLFVDGHFTGWGLADQARPDIQTAGRAPDEWHGFSVRLPMLPQGTHEARVYAVHKVFGGQLFTLQQVDKALSFSVAPSDTNATVSQDWWKAVGQH
ncbi:MAG: hypothetical protein ACJ74W_17730 [Pyrinomonadaceae bacterium]